MCEFLDVLTCERVNVLVLGASMINELTRLRINEIKFLVFSFYFLV